MFKHFKNFKFKLIFISFTSLIMVSFILFLIFTLISNKNEKDPKFVYNSKPYITDLTPIETSSLTSSYIKMNTLYTNTGANISKNNITIDASKKIAIESAMDFYAFGVLANQYDAFLGYQYELLTDIDMNNAYVMDPIGYQNKAFSGTFNGNGHLIKNLRLTPVTQQNMTDFNDTHYYALFCQNSGTVGNFGLIDPIISIGIQPSSTVSGVGIYYVSNVVGLNSGTVSYVFVRDNLEEESKDTPGIDLLYATYHISGLVAVNNSTFTNSYYASSTLISSSNTRPAEMQEILLENNGTIGNLFFYNSLIESVTAKSVRYGGFIDKTFNYNNRFGTWEETIDDLNNAVVGTNTSGATNTWYTGANYSSIGDLSTFLTSIITPVTRGFKTGQITYSDSDNKYYVDINNENDLSYIYELMDVNSKFASNSFVYQLTSNINLDNVLSPKYNNGIASTFTTKGADDESANSVYKTIYLNTLSYKVTTLGIDAYGVFPYLTGRVEYLNFVVGGQQQIKINNNSNNIIAYGAIAGYVEGGEIHRCNVYNNVKVDSDAGKYYVGGAVGILAGEGSVDNTTSAGTITATNENPKTTGYSDVAGYPMGVTIGGAIAYVDSSLGSVDSIYNTTTITATAYSSKEFTVGGVIGSAYFDIATKLQNNGELTVNGSYSKLFASGVVGRLLGISNQISLFTNNGDLTVAQTSNTTYVSGILNADIQTSTTTSDTLLDESSLKQKSKFYFYASSMTNGAKIVVNGTNTDLMYTNGINILNANGFITKLSGVYNLDYRFNASSASLGTQEIDMNRFNSFAPVVLANGSSSDDYIDLATVYNLRDLKYKTTADVTSEKTFIYTGCVLGNNINYTDVRNEGNISIDLKHGISNANTKLIVSGVFNTLDNGFKAASIYNGGDITVDEPENSTSEKKLDMYLSGICYQNNSVDSNQQQNPLSTNFDNSLIGTIDSIINSGKIIVSSYYLEKDTDVNSDPSTKPHINSNMYVGGITYLNKGIITNAFNLGDVDLQIYSLAANKHYEVGGIACFMDGVNAQIRDSANNGDLYSIDVTKKNTKSYVNVGGIVSRNTATNSNNNQVIAFTINYGTLIGFQSADNTANQTPTTAHATAGGILGFGLCNLVNVVNYGTVYSNECPAGIASIVPLGSFGNDVTTFANTLNYGNVQINPQYHGNNEYQTYNEIISKQYARQNDLQLLKTAAGSIVSIFDFNNKSNIKIRYLINFYSGAPTVLSSLNNPSTAPDISTFITATGPNDEFGGNTTKIKYGPLNSIEDSLGNIGVFSSKFILRQIINGEIENGTAQYNTNTYVTDLYIPDYYEFVKFDKVNPVLLEKIGWRTIAYEKAAEDLVKNVSALATLVKKARPNSATTLSETFDDSDWLTTCDDEIINSLVSSILADDVLDSTTIKSLLEYLLTDTNAVSKYTIELRRTIIAKLLEIYQQQGIDDYYTILQSLLYDELIAKIISEDTVQYKAVKDKIDEYLENCNNLEEILETYIKVLTDDKTADLLSPLFEDDTNNYYDQPKYKLLNTLLEGYDSATIASIYSALNITSSENEALLYQQYLEDKPAISRDIFIKLITNRTLDDDSDYIQWANSVINKNNMTSLITSSAKTGTIDSYPLITSLSGYKYSPITTETEWKSTTSYVKTIQSFVGENITSLDVPTPTRDYSELWDIIKNSSNIQAQIRTYFGTYLNPTTGTYESGIIAKATEFTNSYQSNDRPMSSYVIPEAYDTTNKDFYELKQDGITKYYGGINYGDTGAKDHMHYNYFGYLVNNEETMPIHTKFIYTPDTVVSYGTNYFGPYVNTSGQVYDQIVDSSSNPNDPKYLSSNGYDYNIGRDLTTVDTGDGITRGTIPLFMSLSDSELRSIIASSNTRTQNYNTYKYYWNSKNKAVNEGDSGPTILNNYQWKQENFVTYAPKNTTGFLYKNYNTGDWMKYYYNFDPTYVATVSAEKNTNPQIPGHSNITSSLNITGSSHTYKDEYLTAYASSAIITGIWYTYSAYSAADTGNHKCVSLVAKNEPGTNNSKLSYKKYFGVHTSDYICYDMDDLLLLDGKKTKGRSEISCGDNSNYDQDEINIISAIVTKLITDDKALVLNAIASYAENNDFTASQAATASYLLSSVSDTDVAIISVNENLNTLLPMYYAIDQTIREYLDGKHIAFDYKDKLIASLIDDKDKFREFLLYMLNNQGISKKISDYSEYINNYTRNGFYNFIFEYLNYVYTKNGTITESDVNALFAEVTDGDLSKLVDLIKYNYYTSRLYDELVYNSYFKIYNMMLYTKDDNSYNAVTYNNVTYDNILRGIDDTSYIEFPIDESFRTDIKYNITIVYKGTNGIQLDTTTARTSNTITTTTYNNLSGLNKKLYVKNGTEIYSIKLENAPYEEITSRSYGSEIIAPYVTLSTKQSDNITTRYVKTPRNENGEVIEATDYYPTTKSTKYYVSDGNGGYEFATGEYVPNTTYYKDTNGTIAANLANGEGDYYNFLRSNTYCIRSINNAANINYNDYFYAVGKYNSNTKYYIISSANWVREYGIETFIGNDYRMQWKINNYKSALLKVSIAKGANIIYDSDLTFSFTLNTAFSASQYPTILNEPNNQMFPVNVKIGNIVTKSVGGNSTKTYDDVDDDNLYSYTQSATANTAKTNTYTFTIPKERLDNNLEIGIRIEHPCYYSDLNNVLAAINVSNVNGTKFPLENVKDGIKEYVTKYYFDENYPNSHNSWTTLKDFHLESSFHFDYTYNYTYASNQNVNENITTSILFNQNIREPKSSYFVISTNSDTRSFVQVTNPSSFSPKTIIFNQPQNNILTTTLNNDSLKRYTNRNQAGNRINASGDYPLNGALKFKPFNPTIPTRNIGDTYSTELNPNNIKAEPGVNTNFNNGLYDISDIAKYIVRNYIIRHDLAAIGGYRYLNLNAESYVEFKATGTGTITVYNANTNAQVGDSIVLDETAQWYEIKLPKGNYKYATSGTINIEDVVSVYDDLMTDTGIISNTISGSNNVLTITIDGDVRTLLNIDYSELTKLADIDDRTNDINKVLSLVGETENTLLDNFNTEFTEEGTTDYYNKYTMFLEVYPYYRSGTIATLRQNDVFDTISTLWGTMNWDSTNTSYYTLFNSGSNLTTKISSITNDLSYYLTKEDNNESVVLFNNAELLEIIQLIGIADSQAVTNLYNGIDDDYYELLLTNLFGINDSIMKQVITNKLWQLGNDSPSSEIANYIYGAYLGNDYLGKINYYTSTKMYTILGNYSNGDYQFINNDTTVNAQKVQELINHLLENSDINIDGYGIYALSSSHGKLNGEFIPDNLNLDTMDPGYTTTNDIYTLTDDDTTDAAWRGGTGSGDAEDDDSDTNSVNYAFYDEMKQLIKSISTTVFELTLTRGNNTYYGDIDLDNHTITYYVSSLDAGEYTVSKLDLAYRAKAYVGEQTEPTGTRFIDGSEKGTSASKINVTTLDVAENKFTVFAEDTKVHKTYDIIFKTLVTNLTLTYNTTKTSGTTDNKHLTVQSSTDDKKVVLDLTSVSNKLPLGFDLKPYLSFVLMNGENETSTIYKMDSEFVTISSLSTDHKVLLNGSSEITMVVSYKLPAGTYRIKVEICGNSDYVTYVKQSSSDCAITSIKFDGKQLIVSDNMESNIKFGRAYNNIELTNVNGIYGDQYDFYLDNIVISPNASITASVEKNSTSKSYYFDASTSVSYDITSYVVTYVVTAENGTSQHTYTHTLTELDPYNSTVHTYGSLYGDGNVVDTANTEFNAEGKNNQTVVSFERGYETYYRLKYVFTNIYTDNTVTYTKEETTADITLRNKATLNLEYHGISADVNDFCDAGTYSFLYKYSRPQVWDIVPTDNQDGTYSFSAGTTTYIEYTFPRLVIEKTYSTDATLHSIVLIDEYKYQSNASTAMDVDVLRPVSDDLGANEVHYQSLLTGDTTQNHIKVENTINYNNYDDDYSKVDYKDYYLVGTVSNAQLNNYVPTFDIEKHGMIFQTTTLAKIKKYGKGKQDADAENILSDSSILGDHTTNDGKTIYLYIPFTYVDNGETKDKIFLVQLNGKTLTSIYSDRYDGIEASLGTLNKTLDELRTYKTSDNDIKVTIGGIEYTLSKTVGEKNDNPSLYMDYIGNPVSDHFWYVSYVVFSEDYIRNASRNTYVKFFHTALIDVSNNVYFSIKVITPNDAKFTNINEIYITVVGKKYTEAENPNEDDILETLVVGTYVDKRVVDTTANTITYELIYSIQILPSAYYFFNIDLPAGYEATSMVTDPNKVFDEAHSVDYLGHIADNPGAYLPPSSLVVQRVPLTITVTEGNDSSSDWAIVTSDIYTKKAVLVLESDD